MVTAGVEGFGADEFGEVDVGGGGLGDHLAEGDVGDVEHGGEGDDGPRDLVPESCVYNHDTILAWDERGVKMQKRDGG